MVCILFLCHISLQRISSWSMLEKRHNSLALTLCAFNLQISPWGLDLGISMYDLILVCPHWTAPSKHNCILLIIWLFSSACSNMYSLMVLNSKSGVAKLVLKAPKKLQPATYLLLHCFLCSLTISLAVVTLTCCRPWADALLSHLIQALNGCSTFLWLQKTYSIPSSYLRRMNLQVLAFEIAVHFFTFGCALYTLISVSCFVLILI